MMALDNPWLFFNALIFTAPEIISVSENVNPFSWIADVVPSSFTLNIPKVLPVKDGRMRMRVEMGSVKSMIFEVSCTDGKRTVPSGIGSKYL